MTKIYDQIIDKSAHLYEYIWRKFHTNDNVTTLNNLLSVRMKTCVRKTFAFVFPKESAVTQNYVIDFVSGTFSIQTMPFFRRLLTFPMSQMIENNQVRYFDYRYWHSVVCMSEGSFLLCYISLAHDTHCPLDVCKINVTNVDAPGHVQLFANNAYLNSSSQTTCSANFTCNLCSGLSKIAILFYRIIEY